MQWGPGEQFIKPFPYSCVPCQVNNSEWIWQSQIREAIMVSSAPSAPSRGNSRDGNSFYKHNYVHAHLDGKSTKFGLREQRSFIHSKLQVDTEVFEIIDGLLPACACKYVAHGLCTGALLQDYLGIWTLAKQLIRLHCAGQKAFLEILAELLTSTATEHDTYLQKVKSFGVPSDMLPHLILLHQKLGDLWIYRVTYPLCYNYSFSGIGKTITFLVLLHLPHLSAAARSKSENMFANLITADATYEIPLLGPSPDFVHFCDDRIGNLVMISVSIQMSWDPGGNS
jgi:hypothetical protein